MKKFVVVDGRFSTEEQMRMSIILPAKSRQNAMDIKARNMGATFVSNETWSEDKGREWVQGIYKASDGRIIRLAAKKQAVIVNTNR